MSDEQDTWLSIKIKPTNLTADVSALDAKLESTFPAGVTQHYEDGKRANRQNVLVKTVL
ncbi:MAG: hypothetical protein Q8L37_07290 [Candidatus Gottesmanbacteria bacterium]|nr:hypothetical protein [Candidatus Gottesmanbacteria bacterium]